MNYTPELISLINFIKETALSYEAHNLILNPSKVTLLSENQIQKLDLFNKSRENNLLSLLEQ